RGRGRDGREQISLAEGLDEVAEDSGLHRARDELALAVCGHHHDRDRALVEDAARRLDPVEARHLHVEQGHVGLRRARELDRLLPVTRLRADLEARSLEQALEVEPDQRLVLGDEHAQRDRAHRSIQSTRYSIPGLWWFWRTLRPATARPHDSSASSVVRSLSCSLNTPTSTRSA